MKTFLYSLFNRKTEKFFIDDAVSTLNLKVLPEPGTVEAWLNGERMTGLARSDMEGLVFHIGPLRPGDTVIVTYLPASKT